MTKYMFDQRNVRHVERKVGQQRNIGQLETGCQLNKDNVRSIDVLCPTFRCCYSVVTCFI